MFVEPLTRAVHELAPEARVSVVEMAPVGGSLLLAMRACGCEGALSVAELERLLDEALAAGVERSRLISGQPGLDRAPVADRVRPGAFDPDRRRRVAQRPRRARGTGLRGARRRTPPRTRRPRRGRRGARRPRGPAPGCTRRRAAERSWRPAPAVIAITAPISAAAASSGAQATRSCSLITTAEQPCGSRASSEPRSLGSGAERSAASLPSHLHARLRRDRSGSIPCAREPLGSEPDEVGVPAPRRRGLAGDGREVQDLGVHRDRPGDRPGPGEHPLVCAARPARTSAASSWPAPG